MGIYCPECLNRTRIVMNCPAASFYSRVTNETGHLLYDSSTFAIISGLTVFSTNFWPWTFGLSITVYDKITFCLSVCTTGSDVTVVVCMFFSTDFMSGNFTEGPLNFNAASFCVSNYTLYSIYSLIFSSIGP